MLKRTITYTDFDDVVRTEPFYFNLTTEELLRYNLKYGGDANAQINNLIEKKDIAGVIAMLNDLIRMAYGEKNTHGKFVKNQELTDAFVATDAYSSLIMDLYKDIDRLGEFIIACSPADAREAANARLKEARKNSEEAAAEPAEPLKIGNAIEMR